MAEARAAPGSGPESKAEDEEREHKTMESTMGPFFAAHMIARNLLNKMSDTFPVAGSPSAAEVEIMEAERRKQEAAQEAQRQRAKKKYIESLGVDANVPAIIHSLQKGRMDKNKEMQTLLAAERALDAAADSYATAQQGFNPYKRRRITSSELMGNTKYYMAKTPDSLPPDLGELSLSTRSFKRRNREVSAGKRRFDLISSLASYNLLTAEFVKYLHPREILTLYSISRVFHATWNATEDYFARILASHFNPQAAVAFPWELYKTYLVRNPKGYIDIDYTHPSYSKGMDIQTLTNWDKVVLAKGDAPIPAQKDQAGSSTTAANSASVAKQSGFSAGLAWVYMLMQRERQTRDIMACMARKGHRLPSSTRWMLRKLWVVLDCPITQGRYDMMKAWSNTDLYNLQLFLVKLSMMFSDPIHGGGAGDQLRDLMLGQPTGLRCLWQLLRRKRFSHDLTEVITLALMFSYKATEEDMLRGEPLMGVPVKFLGITHTEGWGHGPGHMVQPKELVARESLLRGLGLELHLNIMVAWGYRLGVGGKPIPPTIDDIYMSDDECGSAPTGIDGRAGNVPLMASDWMPHHHMRHVFNTLSHEEQLAVLAVEEDELLKAQAWIPQDDLTDDEEGFGSEEDEGGFEDDSHGPNGGKGEDDLDLDEDDKAMLDDPRDYLEDGEDFDDYNDDEGDDEDDDGGGHGNPGSQSAASTVTLQFPLEPSAGPGAGASVPTSNSSGNSFGVRGPNGTFLVPRGDPTTRIKYLEPKTAPAISSCPSTGQAAQRRQQHQQHAAHIQGGYATGSISCGTQTGQDEDGSYSPAAGLPSNMDTDLDVFMVPSVDTYPGDPSLGLNGKPIGHLIDFLEAAEAAQNYACLAENPDVSMSGNDHCRGCVCRGCERQVIARRMGVDLAQLRADKAKAKSYIESLSASNSNWGQSMNLSPHMVEHYSQLFTRLDCILRALDMIRTKAKVGLRARSDVKAWVYNPDNPFDPADDAILHIAVQESMADAPGIFAAAELHEREKTSKHQASATKEYGCGSRLDSNHDALPRAEVKAAAPVPEGGAAASKDGSGSSSDDEESGSEADKV
ncbi:hypothetical protein RB601_001860 [Gaeumannomyces tritici]